RPHLARARGAHDDEDHVRRHVALPVVTLQALARERLDELARAEDRPAVRVRRVRELVEAAAEKLLRVVLDEAHLLEDHLLLALELLRGKAREREEGG